MLVEKFRRSCLIAAVWLMLPLLMKAQGGAPHIAKVDPPNWWANMPKPMLLIQGENLEGVRFRLSDRELRVERTKVSANGHWAQLWLSASPGKAETVEITAQGSEGKTALPYTFAARRRTDDGFAGFSSKDVMYLIMPDRFADVRLPDSRSECDCEGKGRIETRSAPHIYLRGIKEPCVLRGEGSIPASNGDLRF